MYPLIRILLAVTLGLLAPSASAATAGATAAPPNIVLVMADDQGWGDMAYAGHPHLQTPHFDAFAREGVRFDRFYAAAPLCSPTRGSVLTGRSPNRYGVYSYGHPLRPQEKTLAQALKSAGYRTGHFGKWHLGSVQLASPVHPGAFGFDEWISAPNFFDVDPILSNKGRAVPFQGDSSDVTVEIALQFIRESAQQAPRRPFLAVVWFGSPHAPHAALPKDRALYAGRPKAERDFLGEITAMDRAVGRLREELRTLGLRGNTLLWYCSDNGALPKIGSSGGRRNNKGSIYEGGLLVPALLEWPARLKTPRTIHSAAVTSDIYPTLLEIVGVKVDRQPVLDGTSLWSLLQGGPDVRTKPIGFWRSPGGGLISKSEEWMKELYAEQQAGRESADPVRLHPDAAQIKHLFPLDRFPGHAAWLDRGWKLHRHESKDGGTPTWELYDLATDDRETTNLIDSEPARTAAMRVQLEAWLQSVARSHNGEDYPGKDR
jgi:arylsulfatase A-like enzyme